MPPICAFAHISALNSSTCYGYADKPSEGEETMRRSAYRSPKLPERSIAWREAEYAALRAMPQTHVTIV